MFVVGLTGGIGSGKTTVSDYFAKLGVVVVDSDIVARDIVAPGSECLQAIEQRFGSKILLADGSLDRAQLKQCIFSDTQEKAWLEQLMHPEIQAQTLQALTNATSDYAILASPLLLETQARELANRILVVDLPKTTQVARTIARDNMTEELARKIIGTQIDRDQRLAQADDVIDNTKGLDATFEQADNLHRHYLALARERQIT